MSEGSVPSHLRRWEELAERDDELRRLHPDPRVEAILAQDLRYAELLDAVLEAYASRPALGARAYDVAEDADGHRTRVLLPRFDTITYGDLRTRARAVASALRHHDRYRVAPDDFVGIIGFTGPDLVVMELACALLGGVSVPLTAAADRAATAGILAATRPTVVAVSAGDIAAVADAVAAQRSLRVLVLLDVDERIDAERASIQLAAATLERAGSSASVVTLPELVAAGARLSWEPPPPHPGGDRRMALLIHSSGSTGAPKGAVRSEWILKQELGSTARPLPLVRLSFAPLSHAAGRPVVFRTLAHGGTVHFVGAPDLSTLFEDLRLVRPTDGFFFPRSLEMASRRIRDELARRSGSPDDHLAGSEAIRRQVRDAVLGDRLCQMNVGGAPTPAPIRELFGRLEIGVVDSYGTTEVGSITRNHRVNRDNVIAYRLRDVPELGYRTSDRPYPRGELCVRSRWLTSGYFGRPDATAAVFDADGYFLTGDIVEERGPDHLVYVDRRNDVVKLAQAEFVNAGALATVFERQSELIHQMYVYGTARRAYVVAVVVPDIDLLHRTLGGHPDEQQVRELVRAEIGRVAAAAGLRPFEVPRDFIVEVEPFSTENGLLTSIRKRARPALERRYGERLEALCARIDRQQEETRVRLRAGLDGSTLDTVLAAVGATLGVGAVDPAASFPDMGGDSLAATELAALLSEALGVEIPVAAIVSPTGCPRKWASIADAARRGAGARPTTVDRVHGGRSNRIAPRDLDLAKFIEPAVLARTPRPRGTAPPRTVLLTGATGYLGRFLCLEWLGRLEATPDATLVCLVRGRDQADARARLDGALTVGDPKLADRFRSLAAGRLEVVVGDVAEPRLGLDPDDYRRLAGRVDRIVHPAALVNHVLDYASLFGPNVVGTARVIELALTDRLKPIDFVSSHAVAKFVDLDRAGADGPAPLRDEITLGDEYATGYSASKWAAEHLLHAASERFGIPVNVFRGDMMLAHRTFRAQVNREDTFCRLLVSVVLTGLAPHSFYRLEPDGSRAPSTYDGLPVDVVAAAVARVGAEPHEGIAVYDITNRIDEGVSLDTIVDWVEAAGYPLERIASYDEWLLRFESALRDLPPDRRSRTSFPLLDSLRAPKVPVRPVAGGQGDRLGRPAVDVRTPQLTPQYLEKILDDLVHLGLVPRPARPGRPA